MTVDRQRGDCSKWWVPANAELATAGKGAPRRRVWDPLGDARSVAGLERAHEHQEALTVLKSVLRYDRAGTFAVD